SERVRFGAKKNGYHGGASPQEIVIPLMILAPGLEPAEGFVEAMPEWPEWWQRPEEVAPAPVVETPAKPGRPAAKPGEQGTLFDPGAAAEPTSSAAPSPDWIDALLASETFAAQRAMTQRTALPDDRVRAFLAALDERGGKATTAALVRRVGVPPHR